ncbi:restriction endonuclease [Cognatiluteimonas profundi]|uniref:restriction endonuclease n=1 Tax=Cognatiluteimonas profundi TaxID=2594501 RepID=UPI00131AB6B0|nr:restriction endonuclease [Lysobacter profundi]
MDPLKFEGLIADYYRRQGYRVVECGTGGTKGRYDGGIDLKLYRDDEYIVVQCKRYTKSVAAHNDLHELLGVMHTEGAARAIFINSGEYTPYALRKLQSIRNFQMVDGVQLREMLSSAGLLPSEASIDRPIEPAIEPWTRPSASDYWGDYSLTMPNARPQGVPYRVPEKKAKKDSELAFFVVAGICILLVSCIRHFSTPANRPTAVRNQVVARPTDELVVSLPNVVSLIQRQPSTAPPPPVVAPHQPSQAELREAQRKADEAMNVIKDSTPEM